ncbi:protein translocase subunit SecD [Candidatus Parcubacteria bacterium]|nr:protein translocase subunit SecD [Candidatus Parcubacteria bacterium]
MSKKRIRVIIVLIFILAFSAGNFVEPKYWNNTADVINAKKNEIRYIERLTNIPQMPEKDFVLGLDLQGGTHLVYEADMSNIEKDDYTSSLQGLRDVIERRINLFGITEPVVQVQKTSGHHRLIVELAGIDDPSKAIEMIGETPFLEFREERDDIDEIIAKREEVNKYFAEGKTLEEIDNIVENWHLAFEEPFKSTDLTGKYLEKSELGFGQTAYEPLILLQFDEEGSRLFEELTERNIGKPLAIYIDDIMISSPTVQEKISGGKAQITGKFTLDEAKELVRNLSAGALPVPIALISQQTVGPILGKASLEKSLTAGIYGFLAILLFLIVFYRVPGILSSIALVIYVLLVLSIFKLMSVTLTLAGIGGFILSIGMAVDANILIFSRMREELREGKTFSQSVDQGFNRAWPSIKDGNLTTLIVAFILFAFGTSFVKGFALTLSLGILLSMFSAIFITKNFLEYFKGTRLEKFGRLWK